MIVVVYVDTLQSIAGCDSIITLDLTINESYDDVVDTMYRCRRQCIIGRVLSDDKWSVCRYVISGVWL